MIRPRISLGRLLAVVALSAVDFAMLRRAWAGIEPFPMVSIVALPTANILPILALRPGVFREGGRIREDRVGFQLLGWATIGVALWAFLMVPRAFVNLVNAFHPISNLWYETKAYRDAAPQSSARYRIWWCSEISLLVMVSATCTLAQLLIARFGVWLASRGPDPVSDGSSKSRR